MCECSAYWQVFPYSSCSIVHLLIFMYGLLSFALSIIPLWGLPGGPFYSVPCSNRKS